MTKAQIDKLYQQAADYKRIVYTNGVYKVNGREGYHKVTKNDYWIATVKDIEDAKGLICLKVLMDEME